MTDAPFQAMITRDHYRSLLAKAAELQAKGAYDEARELLESMSRLPDIDVLGPKTVLGLPRRLHAALLRLAKAEGDPLRRIGYQYHLVPPPELLAPHGRFTPEERAAMAEANRHPVPRIVHQIWIGDLKPPPATAAWAAHAAKRGYEHRLWREEDIAALGIDQNPLYRAMLQRADVPGAVDIARYIILERLGGIYLDADWFPVRSDISFHDWAPMIGLTTIAELTPRQTGVGAMLLANSFIASPVGHPVFARLLSALPDVMEALPEGPAWWVTGPLIFTVVARGTSVTVLDHTIVAARFARGTPETEVIEHCRLAAKNDCGLIADWKSW